MNMFRRVGMVGEMLAGLSVAAAAPAPGPASVIADLRPIELHDGIHTVPGLLDDYIVESPFDGERNLSSVRLARGTVDGKPAALLLQAELGETSPGPPADHETATMRIYRLQDSGGVPGWTPLYFHLIRSTAIAGRWCNAQLALSHALSIPLPEDYGGPNRVDGCFAR